MKPLKLEKDARAVAVGKLQRYFADEMETSIGAIPAEMLLNFFTDTIGPFYYNQGVTDAQAVFARAHDAVNDELYGLEQREARTR